MRQRMSKLGLFLLVGVLVLGSLAGCERSAQERETETTESPEASPMAGEPTVGEQDTLEPGQTVVSAVTPVPTSAETMPTEPVPPGEATAAPAPTGPSSSEPKPTEPPTDAEPPPSGSTGGTTWHTVKRGETLSSIARKYGTSWQAIAQANSLQNPNQIYVGQKLKIPAGGGATGCRIRHTVKKGEWVWQIARDYGVSPYDILAANGLTIKSANTIYPGKVLCIP